ncbi:MAG: ankyrin repeat domain-containing protein [Rickettsiales bacterium]|nr:ankyrin repeat domain-containing protein [Rickettsiales bacterium]
MALKFGGLQEILNATNINNVIDTIKEKLQKIDRGMYQEWENNGFSVNHSFTLQKTVQNDQVEISLTLLHIAAASDDDSVMQALIKAGADVNTEDNYGITPLHLAAQNGHKNAIGTLLKAKRINVNAKDQYGKTPLHLATAKNHNDAIEALLKAKRIDVNAKDQYEKTPLHLAAKYDKKDAIEALLKAKGIDVNAKDRYGRTPLHLAVGQHNLHIVEVLLENGAIVNERDGYGCTALHFSMGHKNAIEILLKVKEIDVNAKSKAGTTPLHLAASKGYKDAVETLLKANAEVNVKDQHGWTPLDLAIVNGYEETAKPLIAHEIKLKGSEAEKQNDLVRYNHGFIRELSQYWDRCLDEVERMKEEKVDEGITFYDILTSRETNKLISYAQSRKMVRISEGDSCENKFPIYAYDLKRLLNKIGKQRSDALNVGKTIIQRVCSLGNDGAMYVAEYLSNEDIKNLREAAIQTMDREEISQSLESDVHVEFAAKKRCRLM